MKRSGVTGEADVDETWLGMAAGTIVLVIAVVGVTAHYLRERRRADLLRNFDPHEWWQRTHGAACTSGGSDVGSRVCKQERGGHKERGINRAQRIC
jgi:hypothetical protein